MQTPWPADWLAGRPASGLSRQQASRLASWSSGQPARQQASGLAGWTARQPFDKTRLLFPCLGGAARQQASGLAAFRSRQHSAARVWGRAHAMFIASDRGSSIETASAGEGVGESTRDLRRVGWPYSRTPTKWVTFSRREESAWQDSADAASGQSSHFFCGVQVTLEAHLMQMCFPYRILWRCTSSARFS